MIQTKKKSGFTLVELMVFFVFISLVLAATAPIITKRVKHVPDKIQHGKFICEEGGRQQHYYNASQLISTQNVSKCTFKAPKKNSLFKIELIGGGAGGYDYTKWEETNKTQAAGYSLYPESGPWGSRSIDPTPQQLLTTFGGARFRFSTKTGDAESGENVSILYSGIKSPEIPIDYSKCFTPEDIWDDDVTYCEYDGYSVINASEYAETEEKLKKELVKEPYEYYDKGKLCSYSFSQYSNGTPEIDEETGEIIKDEEGNIVYKYEPTYKVTTSVVKRGAWVPKVNEDNLPYCSVWEKAAANVAARIGNLATCNTADECYNIATPERAAQFRSWVEDEVPTGKLGTFTTNEELQGTGGVGGHTAYLFLDGKIDFCNYEQHPEGCGANCANLTDRAESCVQAGEINDYLNNLFTTYYVIGTVSEAGSCDVWGYKEESKEEATNWKEKLANFKKGSIEVRGKKGFDLLYYYAIKGWGKCATNSIRATGGDGGVVGTDGESVWAYKNRNYEDTSAMVRNGRNSDGLAGAIGGPYPVNLVKAGESAPGIQIPSMAITTTLNVRTHWVGDGGGAGAYETYFVSNLDDDCVFNIGNGGGSVGEGVTDAELSRLQSYQETTLSCNNGTLRLSAAGGRYSTYVGKFTYDGFNYVDLETGIPDPNPVWYSDLSGESSRYPSQDVFTKYNISKNWGAGGHGSSISDYCTRIYGWYEQSLTGKAPQDSDRKQHYNIEKVPCAENEDSMVHEGWAGSGYSGAIIISW